MYQYNYIGLKNPINLTNLLVKIGCRLGIKPTFSKAHVDTNSLWSSSLVTSVGDYQCWCLATPMFSVYRRPLQSTPREPWAYTCTGFKPVSPVKQVHEVICRRGLLDAACGNAATKWKGKLACLYLPRMESFALDAADSPLPGIASVGLMVTV